MNRIASLAADHYRIPLPVVLSDSTHGDIAEFELVTVRLRDVAGAEGLGYTYTVGKGGAAIAALIERDLRALVVGAEPDRIEALWQRMWWALHYGGRGGDAGLAVSAGGNCFLGFSGRALGPPVWGPRGGCRPPRRAVVRRARSGRSRPCTRFTSPSR